MDDPLPWLTAEALHKVVDVNISGTVFGVIAALAAPGLSHIIITGSGVPIMPLEMDPLYTATKFAQLGLGLALAPPLKARGIRLDIILPGAIDTGMTAPAIRAMLKQESGSFIGESVSMVATTDEAGPVWLALYESEGLVRYNPPDLPNATKALVAVVPSIGGTT